MRNRLTNRIAKVASITEKLDKLAAELEVADPRIALALDQISDNLEAVLAVRLPGVMPLVEEKKHEIPMAQTGNIHKVLDELITLPPAPSSEPDKSKNLAKKHGLLLDLISFQADSKPGIDTKGFEKKIHELLDAVETKKDISKKDLETLKQSVDFMFKS